MRFLKRGAPTEAIDPYAPLPDHWQIAKCEIDGDEMIARFNRAARTLAGHRDLGIQIGVAIPFVRPDERGMPESDEVDQLTAFEDTLVEKANGKAVFVGVITMALMRAFVPYTGESEWIAAFHQELRAALPTHDVQLMAKGDPKWSTYREFVKG